MDKIAFHEIEATLSALLAAEAECETDEEREAFQAQLAASLAELADAEEAKADGIAFVLARLEADIKAHAETAASILSRKKSLENQRDRLKSYVQNVFEAHGIQKIKGQSATLYLGKSERVEIDDESSLPADFLVPQPPKIDKTAIKKALKDTSVPGAHIETSTYLAVRR